MPTLRPRNRASASSSRTPSSWSATTTLPESGRSRPAMTIRRGDFPDADRLTTPYIELDVFENMDPRGAPPERQVDSRKRDRGDRALQTRGIVHAVVPSLAGR